ncbi:response regulator transcription factor [Inquilinus sp. Marseille-Q2685]|uniref:response regulator transcription factor n=1 Tax=Inquilinus sp. Marseille-Q2685 TaxID=2866581 RepID=UPI001CE4847E|nr:helix-turn-helix transcriptional regulator [Inquilinus sp. Marseille-Q2685]
MLDCPDPSAAALHGMTAAPGRSRLRAEPRIPPSSPPGEDELLRLIGQAYDAGIGDDAWETVLTSLRDLLGAESGALFAAGYEAPAERSVHVGCDPAFIPPYNDHYHRLSPTLPVMSRLPAGSVCTNHMLVPEAVYTRTEFYHDHIRPQGKYSNLIWVGDGDGAGRKFLCLWRQRWQPAWEATALRVLGAIGPHLARALQIEQCLTARSPRSPAAAAELLAPQERACLAGVARGASSKLIARQLGLSMHTVNAYLATARRKLKAASRSEAVAMALSSGLIDG